MNFNYKLENQSFNSFSRLFCIIIFFGIVVCVLNLISIGIYKKLTNTDIIVYIITSFTEIKLYQSIKSIEDQFYTKSVIRLYFIILSYCMYCLIPKQLIFNCSLLNQLRTIITMPVIIAAITVQSIRIDIYKILHKKDTNKIYIILLVIVILYYFLLKDEHILGAIILTYFIVFSILLWDLKLLNIKSKELHNSNIRLDMSELKSIFIIIIIILDSINIYLGNTNLIIKFVEKTIFMSFSFTVGYIIMVKLLNEPCQILFNDIYEKNIVLNELNNKIKLKNIELEFSQMLMKKKEKMFKSFFVNVPVPLVIISTNERIIFCNESFKEFTNNLKIKNIINKKIFSIITIDKPIDIIKEAKNNGNIISGKIIVNDEIKYVDMEFIDVSSECNEIVIVFNDVTTKIKLDTIKSKVENNQAKERIKNEFLSNISHDLKTPINVIYSASQLINVYLKSNNIKSIEKYNKISRINCISITRLANNLIDRSRIYSDYISADLHIKNIVEVVEETVTSLVDYAKNKDIDLIFDTDEEEIYVNLDENFMNRIIMNLISNSIKFTKDNGTISVSITSDSEFVVVNVTDNGMGMEEEFIKKAFSRYAMEDDHKAVNEKGTGIGLFVVKKLVEKQNGTIQINSKINVGTNMKIKFKREFIDEGEKV